MKDGLDEVSLELRRHAPQGEKARHFDRAPGYGSGVEAYGKPGSTTAPSARYGYSKDALTLRSAERLTINGVIRPLAGPPHGRKLRKR